MRHLTEQFINVAQNRAEGYENDIFTRVAQHSHEFDAEIRKTQLFPPEEIRKAWQTREWKIDDTIIRAIGVMHLPETFLEFRGEIEKAIQESDIVVNEFAPEALGFYDKTAAAKLKNIKSKFNENYNLEQLRQAYIKYERASGFGSFHHEVELLAAKYGKDMAVADLTLTRNPEAALQDDNYWAARAEHIAEDKAFLKKAGLYTGAAMLGIEGLRGFIDELKKPMSRRKFLKLGLMSAAVTTAGLTPRITEIPQNTALKKTSAMENKADDQKLEELRDSKLAEALMSLSKVGYKKIAFIYGTKHLGWVEECLRNPEKSTLELSANKELIERSNPDAFRIYHLSEGKNSSERFVASKTNVWKRKIL